MPDKKKPKQTTEQRLAAYKKLATKRQALYGDIPDFVLDRMTAAAGERNINIPDNTYYPLLEMISRSKSGSIPGNPPPLDNTLKEIKAKVKKLSPKVTDKLLQREWDKSGIIGNVNAIREAGIPITDAYKYYNHLKNLQKQGYTFEEGGPVKKGVVRNKKTNPTTKEKAAAYAKGKKVIDPMEELLSAPQKAAVWLTGNGYKAPSEAMDINNPYGAFAVDALLDPSLLLAGPKAIQALNKIPKAKAAEVAVNPSVRKGLVKGIEGVQDLIYNTKRTIKKHSPKYLKKVEEEIAAGNQWTKDWYSHPTIKQRLADFTDSDNIQGANNLEQLKETGELAKTVTKPLPQNKYAMGWYDSDANSVNIDILNPDISLKKGTVSNTVVHENIHALTTGNQGIKENKFRELLYSTKPVKGGYDQYLTDPTEVHARVGELRRTFDLKPDQEVTAEMINQIYKAGKTNKTSVDPRWFDLIKDKETLRKLFNTLPAAGAGIATTEAMNNKKALGGPINPEFHNESIDAVTSAAMPNMREFSGYTEPTLPGAKVLSAGPVMPNFSPTANMKPNDKAKYSYEYLKDKMGIASHVAAGIVGNLYVESGGFDNNVITGKRRGDGGLAQGIAQWHPNRWAGLVKYAEQKGLNPYQLETQLQYVVHEPGEGKVAIEKTMKAQTREEAAVTWGRKFERPSEKHANWNKRAGIAAQLNYEEGGEVEMTQEELNRFLAMGGEIY